MKHAVLALALCATGAAGAAMPQLDAWGTDSIRVRFRVPAWGTESIPDPPLMGLLPTPPPSRAPRALAAGAAATPGSLSAGNLKVTADASTGLITATRVSDGAVLLKQTALEFSAAAPNSRPKSSAAKLSFAGSADEIVHGLGEHWPQRGGTHGHGVPKPYFKNFSESLYVHAAATQLPRFLARTDPSSLAGTTAAARAAT